MSKKTAAAVGLFILAGAVQADPVSKGTFQDGSSNGSTFSDLSSSGFTSTYDVGVGSDTRTYAYSQLNGGSQALAIGESLVFSFDFSSTQISDAQSGFTFGFDTGAGLFKVVIDTQPAYTFLQHRYGDTYQFGSTTAAGSWKVGDDPVPDTTEFLTSENTPTLQTTLTRTGTNDWIMSTVWGGQTYASEISGYEIDGDIDRVWVGSGDSSGSLYAASDNYTISGIAVEIEAYVPAVTLNTFTSTQIGGSEFADASNSGFTVTYTNAALDSRNIAVANLAAPVTLEIGETLEFSFDWSSTQMNEDATQSLLFGWGFDFGNSMVQYTADSGPAEYTFLAHRNATDNGYPFTTGNLNEGGGFSMNPPPVESYLDATGTPTIVTQLTRQEGSFYTTTVMWGGKRYTSSFDFSSSPDQSIEDVYFRYGRSADSNSVVTVGDNYTISNVAMQTLTLDPIVSFSRWMDLYSVDAETGMSDDPDSDQMSNLLEYALGGDPSFDDAAVILPATSNDGSWLYYVYSRNTNYADISYLVGSGASLVDGLLTNATEEVGASAEGWDGFQTVTNRILLGAEPQQFMGLSVQAD
jgi:hypothetical protein